MAKMNFYTANGFAGSNYDGNLRTKDVAKKVRSYAKKNFSGFKFSVRTEFGLYSDTLYIELKEGSCIPFVDGSRSAERGYMSTVNTVKGYENDLTPEMFKVMDAVTTYASSFRYDDSDSMQDYFDTNFYISIRVSSGYKVTEPKTKKNQLKENEDCKVETANILDHATVECLEIVDYSEKAVAVFGDTKAVKDQLKELGGRFNPSLNYNGGKRAGWIFSKRKADNVRELLAPSAEESKEEAAYEKGEQEGITAANEAHPLEEITFTETNNLNGVYYFDVEGAGIITSAKVRTDIQPCDIFNVYTKEERKYSVTYDGVSLNRSLYNALNDIIEIDNKINSGTLSVSTFYTPIIENVEFYENNVHDKRYIAKDKPKRGFYYVVDTLDNSTVDYYPTKDEAAKHAEMLNDLTGEDGRLKCVI